MDLSISGNDFTVDNKYLNGERLIWQYYDGDSKICPLCLYGGQIAYLNQKQHTYKNTFKISIYSCSKNTAHIFCAKCFQFGWLRKYDKCAEHILCPHDGALLTNMKLVSPGQFTTIQGYTKCKNEEHVFCSKCYSEKPAELYKVTVDGAEGQYYYICASCKSVFCAKCISEGWISELTFDGSTTLTCKYRDSFSNHDIVAICPDSFTYIKNNIAKLVNKNPTITLKLSSLTMVNNTRAKIYECTCVTNTYKKTDPEYNISKKFYHEHVGYNNNIQYTYTTMDDSSGSVRYLCEANANKVICNKCYKGHINVNSTTDTSCDNPDCKETVCGYKGNCKQTVSSFANLNIPLVYCTEHGIRCDAKNNNCSIPQININGDQKNIKDIATNKSLNLRQVASLTCTSHNHQSYGEKICLQCLMKNTADRKLLQFKHADTTKQNAIFYCQHCKGYSHTKCNTFFIKTDIPNILQCSCTDSHVGKYMCECKSPVSFLYPIVINTGHLWDKNVHKTRGIAVGTIGNNEKVSHGNEHYYEITFNNIYMCTKGGDLSIKNNKIEIDINAIYGADSKKSVEDKLTEIFVTNDMFILIDGALYKITSTLCDKKSDADWINFYLYYTRNGQHEKGILFSWKKPKNPSTK